MAETRGGRKGAPAKKVAPAKRAAAKKAVPVKKTAVKKTVPVKKTAAVKKAAPVKKAAARKAAVKKVAVKKAAPLKKRTTPIKPAVADTTPDAMDALPYSEPATAHRRFSNKVIATAAIAAVALIALAGTAFALTRDRGPSKAKFIATADALCRPANGPVTAIVKPTSYPELAAAAGTVVSTTNGEVTQLKALKRPHGADGKAFEPTFAALTATNTAAKALQDAATKKDDVAAIAATKALSAKFTDAATQAKTYGLTACSTGLQPGIDNVTGGSQAVLKTAFVAKADSLCRASARKADAIREPADTLPDLARFLTQNLDLYNKLLTDLKALPVPPGDDATVADMLAAADKVNSKVVELRDAILAADAARLTAGDKEIATLSTAADAKFDAYGLGVCGSNFGNP